jgi:hypothetical protein
MRRTFVIVLVSATVTLIGIEVSGVRQNGEVPQLPFRPFQVAVTAIILAGSLFIILSDGFKRTDKNAAYAITGLLLGFLLNTLLRLVV